MVSVLPESDTLSARTDGGELQPGQDVGKKGCNLLEQVQELYEVSLQG